MIKLEGKNKNNSFNYNLLMLTYKSKALVFYISLFYLIYKYYYCNEYNLN